MASGRARMIGSVESLTGVTPEEAIMVQQRPNWAVVPFAVIFLLVGGALTATGLSSILVFAIAGGLGGAVFALLTDYYVLAAAGPAIHLCRSSKLQARAVEVLRTLDRPAELPKVRSVINDVVDIGGEEYIVSRAFRDRLDTIRGGAAA